MKLKQTVPAIFASLLFASTAIAGEMEVSKTTTWESKVVAVPPTDSSVTTSYKIYGPNRVEYIIDAPPAEVSRLAEAVRTNPDVVMRFQGDIVEGPVRRFKVRSWSNNTQTHTETDMWGNKTTTTTTESTRTE